MYHIDCVLVSDPVPLGITGRSVETKRVQITMAVAMPSGITIDSVGSPVATGLFGAGCPQKAPASTSARPSKSRSIEDTLRKGGRHHAERVRASRGVAWGKRPARVDPALLKLRELARWSGKPMNRYLLFGKATQTARDDARTGCMWANVVVCLADRDMDRCMDHVAQIRSLMRDADGIRDEDAEEAGRYISAINESVKDPNTCASVLLHLDRA